MLIPTHMITGQFAYLCASLAIGHKPVPVETLAAAGTALLPDLDNRQGIVGRLFPWLSSPLEHWVGHRTATHSLLILMLLALVFWPLPTGWWLALVAGFASHAVADMMTPAGVAWFWPSRVRCVLPGNAAYRSEAMSRRELVFALMLAGLSVLLMYAAQGGMACVGWCETPWPTSRAPASTTTPTRRAGRGISKSRGRTTATTSRSRGGIG